MYIINPRNEELLKEVSNDTRNYGREIQRSFKEELKNNENQCRKSEVPIQSLKFQMCVVDYFKILLLEHISSKSSHDM